MTFFQLIFGIFFSLPKFVMYLTYDFLFYIFYHEYLLFNGWGIHLFTGRFGAGKTCSMTAQAYKLCKKYPQITVLTNLKLINFPKHTKILELRTAKDILDAPSDCLVLIDEIGTIFNSRDFSGGQTAVPKVLFQHMCQCRKRRMMIYATVQRFNLLDKQIRDISATVTTCKAHFKHPFCRMMIDRCFDIDDYEMIERELTFKPLPLHISVIIQSNRFRSLYDTSELIAGMLDKTKLNNYLSDEEVLRNRGEVQTGINALDKKSAKAFKKRFRH